MFITLSYKTILILNTKIMQLTVRLTDEVTSLQQYGSDFFQREEIKLRYKKFL